MKIRTPKIKLRPKIHSIKTHEERAIDAIFEDDETEDYSVSISTSDTQETSIETDPPPDRIEDTYDFADYGLDSTVSMDIWEKRAKEFANDFNPHVLQVLSNLDAIKSVEKHLSDTIGQRVEILNATILAEITLMLEAKMKSMILSRLKFSSKQETEIFQAYVIKSTNSPKAVNLSDALSHYLTLDKEMDTFGVNPQGSANSITRSLRER